MPLPQIGNTDDATVALLRVIAMNTGGIPGDGTTIHEGDVAITQAESGADPLQYATSGPGGMVIEAEWTDLPLGFRARVFNFRRFEIPIQIAFANPNERDSWIIPLDPEEGEMPFLIGNARGIRADTLWVRADPHFEDELDGEALHFIAYR